MMFSIKKMILSVLVAAVTALPAAAFGLPANPAAPSTVSSTTGDPAMLESLQSQSQALLELSQQLVTRTEGIDPSETNSEYIMAMLRLSSDIGVMANRIGEMANRIVYTEELIGTMADRITTVSQALLGNNQSTQTNILAAQRNLGALLNTTRP